MTALAITLTVLVLLAVMPVGVRAVFDGTLNLWLTVFGVAFRIYPSRKTKKKKPAKAKPSAKKPAKKPDRSSLQGYLQLLTRLLGKLHKKLLLRELTVHAIFGGDEPELNYGKAWAAIGTVMPLFEELFRIKKRDVGAYFDREEESIRFYARAHATLTLGSLLHIGLHALRGWLKLQKPEKAV